MKKNTVPLLMACVFLMAQSGFAQPAPVSDRNVITTDGTAEVTGRNDSARISVAVVTEAEHLDRAGSENDSKTRAVIQSIKGLGIPNLKLKTSGYRVTPQRDYTVRPPNIKGYEVHNEIEAALEGCEPEPLSQHISKIVAKSVESGANHIQHIQFYIKNRESLENEALKQAVARALQRAKIMAAAAGVKLVRVMSLSSHPLEMPPTPRLLRAADMKAEAAATAPPMEVGESRIRVQVGIIYEIEP